MGDAAFLLIATRPDAALVVLPLSLVVGVLSGWIVDRVNRVDFRGNTQATAVLAPKVNTTTTLHWGFLIFAAPGLLIGILDLAEGRRRRLYWR